jgi:hypothetical protein
MTGSRHGPPAPLETHRRSPQQPTSNSDSSCSRMWTANRRETLQIKTQYYLRRQKQAPHERTFPATRAARRLSTTNRSARFAFGGYNLAFFNPSIPLVSSPFHPPFYLKHSLAHARYALSALTRLFSSARHAPARDPGPPHSTRRPTALQLLPAPRLALLTPVALRLGPAPLPGLVALAQAALRSSFGSGHLPLPDSEAAAPARILPRSALSTARPTARCPARRLRLGTPRQATTPHAERTRSGAAASCHDESFVPPAQPKRVKDQ